LIKGTFKDHIVTWVTDYIKAIHSECEANKILDDIDQQWIFNYILQYYTNQSTELHWHLHLQASNAFQKVEAVSNGLGMIKRHL
jgi:hypothetical protein